MTWVITTGEAKPRDQVHLVRSTEAVRGVESGSYSIVTQTITQQRTFTMPDPLVLTPGGFRPKFVVRHVERGRVIDGAGNRLRLLLSPRGGMLEDLGTVPPARLVSPDATERRPFARLRTRIGSGWIAYGSWTNNTGRPISLFRSTWTVPPETLTHSGKPSSCSTGSRIRR